MSYCQLSLPTTVMGVEKLAKLFAQNVKNTSHK